jgi:signal transduction histidine kinase
MDAAGPCPPYRWGVQVVSTAQRAWAWGKSLSPWVLDAVMATFFVIFGFVGATTAPPSDDRIYEALDWRAYLLILAITLPYYFRRRFPLSVFVISAIGIVVYSILGFYEGGLPSVVLVGMYTVGAYSTPRRIVVGFSVMMAALVAILIAETEALGVAGFAANVAFFSVALLFGWTVQTRRLRLAEAEERAAILEREQEEERARAIADERLRIAQELHDVVAHSMSVIAVQAGVGMHVADTDAAEAKRALENISATSRSTLTELRRLLDVLRDDGSGAAYAPAPGLGDLDKLAREVTEAGVPVEVQVDGQLDEVPPGVDLTSYRIVQEALTNVLKHAGPSSAVVRVSNDTGTLHIEVVDDGRGVNGRSTGGGHGLVGMRERVAVYGGTLQAGPTAGGGFRVHAELPYAVSGSDR